MVHAHNIKTVHKPSKQTEDKNISSGRLKDTRLLLTRIPSRIWYLALALSFLFFILYLSTAPAVNVGYGDSDGLLAIAYRLGLGMPPGNSVYLLLLHFVTNLPIPGSVAFRGHLLSALLHALTLVFVFTSTWRLIEFLQHTLEKPKVFLSQFTDRIICSILTVVLIGTNFLFWLYGSIAEKFAFTDLLTALIIFTGILLFTSEHSKHTQWLWLLAAFVYGILLFHFPLAVFLVPLLVLFGYYSYRKAPNKKYVLIFPLLGFSLGVGLSLSTLVWLNSLQSPVGWHIPYTLKDIAGFFQSGVRNIFNQQVSDFSTPLKPININASISSLPGYIKTLSAHIGIFGMMLVALGGLVLYQVKRQLFYILTAGAVPVVILLPLYLEWPSNFSNQAYVMRYYLPGYLLLSLFTGVGLWLVLTRVKKALSIIFQNRKVVSFMLLGIFIMVGVFRLWSTYKDVYLKDYFLPQQFIRSVLDDLPKDALLGCFDDSICYSLLYEQNVNRYRTDVKVIPDTYAMNASVLLEDSDLHGFSYDRQPFIMFDYLTWNIDKHPVFVINLPKSYYEMLGIDYGFTYYVSHGYYGQLARELPDKLPQKNFSFAGQLKQLKTGERDLLKDSFKAFIARIHIFNSAMDIKMGFREEARNELNVASDLLFQLPQVNQSEIESTRRSIESRDPQKNFELGSQSQTTEEILQYIDTYLDKGRLQVAYRGALGVVAIDPLNESGRVKLAQIFERLDERELALVEYKNVLRYYPNNQVAQLKIKELE